MSFSTAGPETTGPARPAETNPAHCAQRTRDVVRRLAGEEFSGRRVGTPGGRAAALWLAGHLSGIGARVRLDEFAVTGAVKELSATPVLIWHQDRGETNLLHRRDFA